MNAPAILAALTERRMAYRPKWVPWSTPWGECDRQRRELLDAAWRIGELGHLLTPSQLRTDAKMNAWSDQVADNQLLPHGHAKKREMGRVYVLDSARRWGKSRLLLKRALEKGATHRSRRMIYFGPIKKELLKIVHPLMANLVQDCPPGLLGKHQGPDWIERDEAYVFKTGTRLEIIGLDKNPDGARGTGIDDGFGDEVAFFDDLEYLLNSIIMPQVLGRPHARLELASTPPRSPDHFWTRELVERALKEGAHDTRTIEEADQYEVDEIEEMIRQLGGALGRKHTAVQREFFCQHVTDETLAIIPEFRHVKDEVVKTVEAPYWRYCVTSMDPGWRDHTAVLFGYWNFELQCGVIEDEVCAPRLNSAEIATEVKRKEEFLWPVKSVPRKAANNGAAHKSQPYMRVTDHDPRLQQDLARTHGLVFLPTLKDNLEQQVNALRIGVGEKRLFIHPRCVKTIQHLKNATWKNRDAKIFAREGGDLGHYDTLAALVYLWRAFQQIKHLNPAPFEARLYDQHKHEHGLAKQSAPATVSKWQRVRGRTFLR